MKTRHEEWKKHQSNILQSTEQTKNNADTNYLNREGLQVSTWKNLKDSVNQRQVFSFEWRQDNADTQKTDQLAS